MPWRPGMDENISTEQKTWQVYNFGKINVVPWGWDTEGQPLSLSTPVPLLCKSPVISNCSGARTQLDWDTIGPTSILGPMCTTTPLPVPCVILTLWLILLGSGTEWDWDREGIHPQPLFSYRHFSVPLQTLNSKLHKSHSCPKTNLCMPEWSPSLQTPVWFVQVMEKPPVSTPPCHLCSQDPADHVNWTHRPTACQDLYVH